MGCGRSKPLEHQHCDLGAPLPPPPKYTRSAEEDIPDAVPVVTLIEWAVQQEPLLAARAVEACICTPLRPAELVMALAAMYLIESAVSVYLEPNLSPEYVDQVMGIVTPCAEWLRDCAGPEAGPLLALELSRLIQIKNADRGL